MRECGHPPPFPFRDLECEAFQSNKSHIKIYVIIRLGYDVKTKTVLHYATLFRRVRNAIENSISIRREKGSRLR